MLDDLYFIAEIGQNHNGSLSLATEMINLLSTIPEIKAIKTVKRDLKTCLTKEQWDMPYNNPHSYGRTYGEHREHLEFSEEEFLSLKYYAESKGFDFISSFTDIPSLNFLIDIKVSKLKVPSQRMADLKLIKELKKTDIPIILSTGMCNINMINEVVNLLKEKDLTIMQCTSIYPSPVEDLNLNVLNLFKKIYSNYKIGFSSHFPGFIPSVIAFIKGATVFENHFTMSRSMRGTDHAGSLEIKGFEYMIKYINQTHLSLGSEYKEILDGEKPFIKKLRGDLLH
jgi:sialic acid synthase SpsE